MQNFKLPLPAIIQCGWLLLYFFAGCNTSPALQEGLPPKVSEVIHMAGSNQRELLAVIHHYKGNPLKLKAAYYLIENLKYQFHYEGGEVKRREELFNVTDSLLRSGQIITNKLWDSLRTNYQTGQYQEYTHKVRDLDVIKGQYLINNIDGAFVAWQYPWAKSLNFTQFCEYILPYKILDENYDNWREICQKKYKWVLTQFNNCQDPRIVCSRINDTLKTEFDVGAYGIKSTFDISYSDLAKARTGVCDDAAQYATYVMRAMGLPVSIDHCPFWANKNSGHTWCSLKFNGKTLPFEGCESNPGETKIEFTKDKWIRRKSGKIFRHTFRNEIDSLPLSTDLDKVYGELSLNTKIKDVTAEYTDVGDVRLMVDHDTDNQPYAYLCVFNNLRWYPVFYSKINWFNSTKFYDMAKDIAYMPMFIRQGTQIPAGRPFVYKKDGGLKFFSPDTTKRMAVILRSKYPEDRYEEDKTNNIIPGEHYELFYWNNSWLSLGKQTAKGNMLNYNNVPANALLWLRDLDKGKQERIFTYNNDKQIWW